MGRKRRTIEDEIAESAKAEIPEESEEFVSTGSTLLNLAITDNARGGWPRGKMSHIVGDSSAGKTIVALTACAEGNRLGMRPILDDVEAANSFNMDQLFGGMELEWPSDEAEGSDTVEDFHDYLRDALDSGTSFVYALDSFDSLGSEEGQKHIQKARKAREKGNESGGTFALTKQKYFSSQMMPDVIGDLKKANSVLHIISQTRDDINPLTFSKKNYSGGKALKFYATIQVWLAVGKKHTKKVRGKNRQVGVDCVAKISKNKITGKIRTVQFPIYYDYGIDDTRSCIEWLIEEGFWKRATKAAVIKQDDFEECTTEKMIAMIEADNELYEQLKDVVQECWDELEDEMAINKKAGRKKKY